MAYPIGFYVYRLCDPRTGIAFYVGKGQNGRAWQHEKDFVSGRKSPNLAKAQRIADIVGFGLSIIVEIVAVYDNELDALDHEFRLIDADATLTNVQPGGIGRIMSPIAMKKLRERRFAKIMECRAQQRAVNKTNAQARGLSAHQSRVQGYLDLAKNKGQADEISAWLADVAGKRSAARDRRRAKYGP